MALDKQNPGDSARILFSAINAADAHLIRYKVDGIYYFAYNNFEQFHCSTRKIVSQIAKVMKIQKGIIQQIHSVYQSFNYQERPQVIKANGQFETEIRLIHSNLKYLKRDLLRMTISCTAELFCVNCRKILNQESWQMSWHLELISQLFQKPPDYYRLNCVTQMIQRLVFQVLEPQFACCQDLI